MRQIKSILLGLLLLISFLEIAGQSIERRFKNYTLEDGLSQSTIIDIKQDKNGYVWLATADGVNVFNGAEFEVYKKKANDSNSLSSNFINVIQPLPNGKIWAITQDRIINEINPETKQIKRIKKLTELQEDMYVVGQSLMGYDGNIWLRTLENGVFIINTNAEVVRKISTDNNLVKSNIVNNMHRLGDKIYLGTSKGLTVFSKGSNRPEHYREGDNIAAVCATQSAIYCSNFNNNLLFSCNPSNPNLLKDSIMFLSAIVNIVAQKDGSIWAGSISSGVFEINNKEIQHYTHSPIDRWSLIDNNIFSLYKDPNGNIWIGTNSGLSVYKKPYNVFKLLRKSANKSSISSNKIYDIYEDNSKYIWFINYDGTADRMSPDGNFETFNPELKGNFIRMRSIEQLNDNIFLIGTNNQGLYQLELRTKEFTLLDQSLENIRKIKPYKEGSYFIAHRNGVALFDTENGDLENNIFENKDFLAYDVHLQNNFLYVAGFPSGLLRLNLSTKEVKIFREKENGKNLSSNNLMAIVPIHEDTLAIGTYGGGLSLFNLKTETFTNYSEANGLRNNSVYGIIQDDNNNLWLSTNIGISKLYSDRKKIKNYDLPIQLQSLEFNEDAFLKASNGNFYFGGINGINFFKPEEVISNNTPPKAKVNEMIVDGINYNIQNGEQISLSYKANDISFIIGAQQVSVPEKTIFRYMLVGLENEWRERKFTDQINYYNLPSGSYTFTIKACNEDGLCDSTAKTIQFEINSPIYKRWWFLTLIIILLVSGIIAFFRYRTNNLRAEYLAKMTNAELRALRIQMNPHFIFNSLNSIQYYVLNSDSKTAYKYLTKFSSLMRKTLQHSKENYLPLSDELDALKIYLDLENMRLEGSLKSTISVDGQIDTDKTLIPTLFLQPFVENAIIHGLLPKEGYRQISLVIKSLTKGFSCTIKDNGIGRKAARELNKNRNRSHKSTALEAIESRIKILNANGNIKIGMEIKDIFNGDIPAGTEIVLTVV